MKFKIFLFIFLFTLILGFFGSVNAQELNKEIQIKKWAFLSAAVAVGIASIAGGIAVAYVGSSAIGAMSEKPELATRALIYVGLAEGIAIYGLIIAIMILGKI